MQQELLRSGMLARLTGVSTDLLRHYERIGILPPPARGSNNYRMYPAGMVSRVRAVRRSLSLGFSLTELARIFGIRDHGGIPCRKVRLLAEKKLRHVEQSLLELKAMRRQLQSIVRDWDRRLYKTPRGQRAGLLESLDQIPAVRSFKPRMLKKGSSPK